jgi:hypothetical protein
MPHFSTNVIQKSVNMHTIYTGITQPILNSFAYVLQNKKFINFFLIVSLNCPKRLKNHVSPLFEAKFIKIYRVSGKTLSIAIANSDRHSETEIVSESAINRNSNKAIAKSGFVDSSRIDFVFITIPFIIIANIFSQKNVFLFYRDFGGSNRQ